MLDSAPIAKEPLPELILLMHEPLIVDAGFLRSRWACSMPVCITGGGSGRGSTQPRQGCTFFGGTLAVAACGRCGSDIWHLHVV